MSHVHDGQRDAMPCTCPACASPFITAPRREIRQHPAIAQALDNIEAARVCPVWCGDACTCGRGPEAADLDPIDVAGMRQIEGRA